MSDKLGGPVPILPGPGLPNDPDIDPGGGTPFSDNPLEHSILSATFMVGIMVTWLILGHKIQGMFSWYATEPGIACKHVFRTVSLTELASAQRFVEVLLQDKMDI